MGLPVQTAGPFSLDIKNQRGVIRTNCLHTTISIGLEHAFRALHLSDSHICLTDARDGERKVRLAESRGAHFDDGVAGRTERLLNEQLAYADANDLPILYTGDFCDFVSMKNLEYMRDTLGKRNCFMAAGNHEYSLYVGEAFEDEAYKMRSFDLVQSWCGNDLRFASRVMSGVNFVAVDNVYYDFTARQLELLRTQVARGLPIVMMMHTPLYTPDLYEFVMKELRQPCAYLAGVPVRCMETYPPDRRIQQEPTPDTLAFIEYVYQQPLIRAVLAGHLHYDFDTRLPGGIMQYVTGGGFRDCAREITFE